MFKIFIIIFREILEIVLILGLISVATKDVKGRTKYIAAGGLAGLAGATLIAVFTSKISNMFDGYGQELVNAGVLLIAASMIIWTVVWMRQNSKKVSDKIKRYGSQQLITNSSLIPLSVIIALSMLREGSEIVLFSYGVAKSTSEPAINLVAGGFLGAGAAAIVGVLIYTGIMTMSRKYIFKITSVMLSLIAASMAAQAANFLSMSGTITSFQSQLWNSSWLISQDGPLGKMLNVLVGYIENPTMIELIFYVATLVLIALLSRLTAQKFSYKNT